MPELVEVETYRLLAEQGLGREVAEVVVPDPHCLLAGTLAAELAVSLRGSALAAARRRGKLLLLDYAAEPGVTPHATVGMHFGMSGALVMDGTPGVDRLIYTPAELQERWVRFRVRLADGGELVLHDPRRLGRVGLDPDEGRLGPDALNVTLAQLRVALAARPPGPPLKARLLDQARISGIGNLIGDEVLWRCGLAPTRPCASLTDPEVRALHRSITSTARMLARRGGSHLGDLMAQRVPGGHCPRDGAPLQRAQVGGRTTYWCPVHQL